MDDLAKHRYATRGYHEFGVLADSDWLQEANALVRRLEAEAGPPFRYREGWMAEVDTLLFHHLETEILERGSVLNWLCTLLGEDWHVDHFCLDSQPEGPGPLNIGLHGPGYPHDRRQHHTVKNGQVHETMVVVSLSLVDVNPGDGGLAVVPGSHHNTLPFQHEWSDLSQWPETPYPVEQVCARAGGVVLFTEALVHGTLPWRGKGTRRTVLAKCAAEGVRWAEDRRELLVEE